VLHVKALAADHERVFIGSMNFDPRSWSINTEIGLLIDHPALARRLQDDFLARMQSDAWRVTLVDGRLHWRGDDGIVHHHEPQAAWHWRLATWLIARLPVQSQL
jgi:putative cardiolipin synthase